MLKITVPSMGPYDISFLEEDMSPMNNPVILSLTGVVPSIVDGAKVISVDVPSGIYTIPILRVFNSQESVASVARYITMGCSSEPAPTPVPISPIPAPTPIAIPTPTPVAVTPVACNLINYLMTPSGNGPDATWSVSFLNQFGVRETTNGNGLDSPRVRCACEDSLYVSGSVVVTQAGLCGSSPAPAPTPVAPSPVPVSQPPSPTPSSSPSSPVPTPTPTPVNSGSFAQKFVVNGSGNSFDVNQSNGISPNKVGLFTTMAQNGVDVIRHTLSIGDFAPSNGVYKKDKLSSAISWANGLRSGIKSDILFVPTFPKDDPRFNLSDLHMDSGGHVADCTVALKTVPSYFSPNAIEILDEIYDELFLYLAQNHEDDLEVLSFAGGNSEEHYMPFASNFDGGPGCGNNGYGGIGDYSSSALAAWRVYQTQNWEGYLPFTINGQIYQSGSAPLPHIPTDNQNNRFVDLSKREIREVVRFWNTGVFKAWERFRDKAKQYLPNVKVESFVADMYNQQGIQWTMNAGAMHKLMQKCDVWYHTEHISPYEWTKYLVGTDILKGGTYSFGKLSSIEVDSTDTGTPGGQSFDEALLEAKIVKFIEHGGDYIHWALDWSSGQLEQIGRVMGNVKQRLANGSIVVKSRSSAPIVELNTANMFVDGNYIYTAWEQSGNSRNSPFDAHVVNVRVNDDFWNE